MPARKPKIAKGTRDYEFSQAICRKRIELIVEDCFRIYGGSPLSTPTFELKDILTNKYGEDSKLIYELKDQGGEELALRYDLTVPLCRNLATKCGNIEQSKVYQIGEVYRRDNPVMSKGRLRQFKQADFDIAGNWEPMIPEAQIISMTCTILTKLEVGNFTIKVNNRKILDGIFEVSGVPRIKLRAISSAVDKLDKICWSDVKKEMTEDKGLDPEVADQIGTYILRPKEGAQGLLDELSSDKQLSCNTSAREGLGEMRTLFEFLNKFRVPMEKVTFDLSLARGLDYYTGTIYEAVVLPEESTAISQSGGATSYQDVSVGSIAAGGRYDNLVGTLTAASNDRRITATVPCVGVSMGLDRIFAILWPKWENKLRDTDIMIYVMNAKDSLLDERIDMVAELWKEGIPAEFLSKRYPKLQTQFAVAAKNDVPFVVILGAEELKAGKVRVKQQSLPKEKNNRGILMRRDELVNWVKNSEEWKNSDLNRETIDSGGIAYLQRAIRVLLPICFVSLSLNLYLLSR